MHLFKKGDIVVINEDACYDSADRDFLLSLAGREMKITAATKVDPDLWHYVCTHNGSVVRNKTSGLPFPFIDADLMLAKEK